MSLYKNRKMNKMLEEMSIILPNDILIDIYFGKLYELNHKRKMNALNFEFNFVCSNFKDYVIQNGCDDNIEEKENKSEYVMNNLTEFIDDIKYNFYR